MSFENLYIVLISYVLTKKKKKLLVTKCNYKN